MSVIQIIKDDSNELNEKATEKGFSFQLSHFDIPQEMEASIEKDRGTISIAFGYPDNEEGNWIHIGSQIEVKVGNYSGKVLACKVPYPKINNPQYQAILKDLIKALREASSSQKKVNQKKNFSAVGNVLNRYQTNLLDELSSSR